LTYFVAIDNERAKGPHRLLLQGSREAQALFRITTAERLEPLFDCQKPVRLSTGLGNNMLAYCSGLAHTEKRLLAGETTLTMRFMCLLSARREQDGAKSQEIRTSLLEQ
jgi:hypothetical protein